MSRPRLWRWGRLAAGAAILALLVWRLGARPFLDGLRRVDATALLAALGLNAVATVASAWRWRVVARGLGTALPFGGSVAAYYRAQFLNTTLPGGVLGDVHRGVRHGQAVDDVGRGVRAVVWERVAGQVVQVLLAVVVLALFPSPARPALPWVLVGAGAVAAAAVLVWTLAGRSPLRWLATIRADVRTGLLAPHAWPAVVATSVVVVAAHTATFLVAARTAGADASVLRLLPLAVVTLLAMSVPANVGGWGPREGVAAWAFAAAGMGAAQGVAAATVYGVLVFTASLPGAVVLLAPRLAGRAAVPAAAPPDRHPLAVGSGHG
jgi:glycosyltransferase 2 family protein